MKLGFKIIVLIFSVLFNRYILAQNTVLDNFETTNGWSFIQSDGVQLKMTNEIGINNNAIRIDYNFTKGTGYGGIQKFFDIPLPDNYQITFYVKADSPANNFEIKFLDASGDNVWWKNNRNYTFPTEWKKIKIKKRNIEFAWGPSGNTVPQHFDRIEFTIASFLGGKGTIWIDDLKFEELPSETIQYPIPEFIVSSTYKTNFSNNLYDSFSDSFWESNNSKSQYIVINFKQLREIGGIEINWQNLQQALNFDILTSNDAKKWEKIYSVTNNYALKNIIRLPETDTKYLKINLLSSNNNKRFAINNINFLNVKETETKNNYFKYFAKKTEKGNFPRYFLDQKTYWSISGVNNDVKEALIGEDGNVEVEKGAFSIEPFIKYNNKFYTWANVQASQTLNDNTESQNFIFKPAVHWDLENIKFSTEIVSGGEANKTSQLFIKYKFYNKTTVPKKITLYLLARPFQVNPSYQDLNLIGGVGKISNIKKINNTSIQVDDKTIYSSIPFSNFSTYNADQTDVVDLIKRNSLSQNLSVTDLNQLATGVMEYQITIPEQENFEFFVTIPYHSLNSYLKSEQIASEFNKSVDFWNQKINHIQFKLPTSADRIVNTYKANLVYILINRDKAGIQPGSRSYERSWIRDGSLTSSALLKSGIVQEVKDYIDWYSQYLYENGKVPCVVDTRGPDPVPENDSHGQFIYAIREYYNFTKDTVFLQQKNDKILQSVSYIEKLIAERSIDYYQKGNDSIRSLYGLVPESISHEGYSAKPMHSYWDNFFILKGLKDAVDIQRIIGNKEQEIRIADIRNKFQTNLYNSIGLAMKNKSINYIPGCAELGDFDATSTTVALSPCNEYNHLPQPELQNTFDKYYENFVKRKENLYDWVNYTPYENRVIGSFIMLNQPERAHELIDYFLNDQRPSGWYHWAEVVWKEPRLARYIGDMPHTWVGSDFLNAIRTMFVYENEWDNSLVLASALYQDWIDNATGMAVENLPTYYGEISYAIKKDTDKYNFTIWGNVNLPENGIKIQNFNQSKLPKKILVNGEEITTFTEKFIQIHKVPSNVEIYY